EQIRGPSEVDARADVYAAGVILYELLAGRCAFDAGEMHAVIAQVLSGRPAALAEARVGLAPELLGVVERAMAPEPGARFANATALASALLGARAPQASDDTASDSLRERRVAPLQRSAIRDRAQQ